MNSKILSVSSLLSAIALSALVGCAADAEPEPSVESQAQAATALPATNAGFTTGGETGDLGFADPSDPSKMDCTTSCATANGQKCCTTVCNYPSSGHSSVGGGCVTVDTGNGINR